MATLYIREYQYAAGATGAGGQIVPCGSEPAITDQTVAIGGGSARSNPFNVNTNFVRLHCDVICSINFGPAASVTAATTDARMAAGQTEFFGTSAGLALAVIANV